MPRITTVTSEQQGPGKWVFLHSTKSTQVASFNSTHKSEMTKKQQSQQCKYLAGKIKERLPFPQP